MSTARSRVVPVFVVNDGELRMTSCGGQAVTGGAVGYTGTRTSTRKSQAVKNKIKFNFFKKLKNILIIIIIFLKNTPF